MQSDLIVKSNDLVEARYRLSHSETKIIALLTSVISKDDEDFKVHRFMATDLLKVTGLGDRNHDDLRDLTKNLMKKVLEFREGNRFLQVSFLSSVEYHFNEGFVDLCFDPKLKPYLLELKESFIKYKLGSIVNLNSFYSIRFYELLVKWKKIGQFNLSIKKIKELFQIDKSSYKRYNDFKKAVLLKAQEELKEKTDLYFEFREIKTGRKITDIEFKILTTKNKIDHVEVPQLDVTDEYKNKPNDRQSSIRSKLIEIGVSKKTIEELIKEYPEDQIEKQIKYLPYRRAKNKAAFIVKAIKGDWEPTQNYLKEKEKEKTKEEKKILESKIKEMVVIAKKANYIMTTEGKKKEIVKVYEDGDIKVKDESGRETVILAKIAMECAFTA